MKKTSLIAALVILSINAHAAETKPQFDARNCKAEYPKSALLNEEQGTVTASFLVEPDGRVADSKLDKSSGSRTLDKAAIKAISACKFKPAVKNGAPSQAWAQVEYIWSL